MLKGVNDTAEDAKNLVKLIKGIPSKINLIPFNEWPCSPYECSEEDFALCSLICQSKVEVSQIIQEGLDLMYEEG